MRNRKLFFEGLEARRVFAGLLLNEVLSDPSGTDAPFEYVEIKGTPGALLTDIYFVSIEGDSASQGLADVVVNLSGQSMGSNGLLVIKADGLGHAIPAETTIVVGPEAFNSGGGALENGSNSFALIRSPSGIVAASDLDPENDGILNLPSGATLIDCIGWIDGGAGDLAYGAVLTQAAAIPAGAATRFLHDNRALNTAAWYSGDMAAPNSSTAYTSTVANRSSNFPVGGAITPGNINVPGDSNLAPTSVADEYQIEPGGSLVLNAGSGVLGNDSDPNGINSLLWAVLDSAAPGGASSFVFNDNGSFSYVSDGTVGDFTFAYKATDLNLFGASTTVTIKVVASTNSGPTLAVPAGPTQHTEGAGATLIAVGATVTDSDSPNFASGNLTVSITSNAESADRLSVRNQGSAAGEIALVGSIVQYAGTTIGTLSGGSGSSPLVVELNNNATVESVQALVRNVTYMTESDNPGTLNRTIKFVVNDGDGGPSGGLSNEASTVVEVVATNDSPAMAASRNSVYYAAEGNSVTIDGLIRLTDPDSLDFNAGVLTVTIASNGLDGDQLRLRNTGTGAGQISVAGGTVSYGGVAIGTLTEGSSTLPMTVTFNSAATQASVQAVLRSVVFATSNTRKMPSPRTVSMKLTDGDGGTSTVINYAMTQSQSRRFAFQEGVDYGQGPYTGAADIQIAENRPDTPLPEGANPLTEGLLVDFDGGTANSQVLLRFDNIFGSGEGQIPLGANIVSARLVVNTKNGGDGATLHRMLTSWDANTETWNTMGNGVAPRNSFPGGQADGSEARVDYDSQIGVSFGNSDAAANPTIIGVTADLQAWSAGALNYGWLMQGWNGMADGWAFSASESSDSAARPRLEVEWLPATVPSVAYRQGVNGYAGTVDTALTQSAPDTDNSASTASLVDYKDAAATNTSQVLIRFDDIIGSSSGRVPAGALVHSAILSIASTTSNAQGDGGKFHAMKQAWTSAATWNSLVDGVSPDDVEAYSASNTQAGNASLTPNAEAGFNTFDVTVDVQAWVQGTVANNGWAILPWTLGTDGWGVESSEAAATKNRPELRVSYTPVGVSITPTASLVTTESGGSVLLSFALNTPPSADVTIPIRSSDTTEGTLSVSSLTFTAANWEIPQLVAVTGVSDSIVDGDVAYTIVTDPATSSDPNYNGFDALDISIVNKDETPANQPPLITVSNASVSGSEGTTLANSGTWSDSDAGDVVTLSASSGSITKNSDGTWSWSLAGMDDTASTSVTITATDSAGAVGSVSFTYTVTNKAPGLTVALANVTGNALTTLTNSGTWTDVPADTVTLSASKGTVTKNADGTWSWSLLTTAAITGETVTITGTDEDGGSSSVSFTIDALVAVTNSKIYYLGSSFAGTSVDEALDTDKVLAKSGPAARTLGYENLINNSRGINGLVFDVAGLASSSLSSTDFVFRVSPTGAFDEGANPPSSWSNAVSPTLISVGGGSATTPSRVRLEWADNAISNRWLQIKLLANANTGLREPQVYYVGHLFGETNGTLSGGVYSVSVADVTRIRPAVGTTAPVSSVLDINKNGLIQVSDITAMRSFVGVGQLRNITIPASGSGSEGEGSGGGQGSPTPVPELPSVVIVGRTESLGSVGTIGSRLTDRDYAVQSARVEPVALAVSSPALLGVAAASSQDSEGQQAVDYSSVDAFFEGLSRKDKSTRVLR